MVDAPAEWYHHIDSVVNNVGTVERHPTLTIARTLRIDPTGGEGNWSRIPRVRPSM
jgi:hypothetical protein